MTATSARPLPIPSPCQTEYDRGITLRTKLLRLGSACCTGLPNRVVNIHERSMARHELRLITHNKGVMGAPLFRILYSSGYLGADSGKSRITDSPRRLR